MHFSTGAITGGDHTLHGGCRDLLQEWMTTLAALFILTACLSVLGTRQPSHGPHRRHHTESERVLEGGGIRHGVSDHRLLLAPVLVGVTIAWALVLVALSCGVSIVLYILSDHKHTHEAISHGHARYHDDEHHAQVHPSLPAGAWHNHRHEHDATRHRTHTGQTCTTGIPMG